MHWLVWITTHKGPRPQRWTHDPARASQEARALVLVSHPVPTETRKSIDELAAMFPAPVTEEPKTC